MNKFFENLKIRSGYVCVEEQPLESKKKGFTLAETLITLTILGVVAAITIPALINKYIEATNRTKVRKAMATYEKALGQMVVENGNTAISAWADGITNNCANTTVFFKKIAGEGCRFQTADKVWWDISDIEHPVISINGEIDNDMVEHPENYKDTEGLFYMVGTIDNNGILRINDLNTVPLSADDREALEKLYAFVNGEKETKNNTNCNNTDYICLYKSGENMDNLPDCNSPMNCMYNDCHNCKVNTGNNSFEIYGEGEYPIIRYTKNNDGIIISERYSEGDNIFENEYYDNGILKHETISGEDGMLFIKDKSYYANGNPKEEKLDGMGWVYNRWAENGTQIEESVVTGYTAKTTYYDENTKNKTREHFHELMVHDECDIYYNADGTVSSNTCE